MSDDDDDLPTTILLDREEVELPGLARFDLAPDADLEDCVREQPGLFRLYVDLLARAEGWLQRERRSCAETAARLSRRLYDSGRQRESSSVLAAGPRKGARLFRYTEGQHKADLEQDRGYQDALAKLHEAERVCLILARYCEILVQRHEALLMLRGFPVEESRRRRAAVQTIARGPATAPQEGEIEDHEHPDRDSGRQPSTADTSVPGVSDP